MSSSSSTWPSAPAPARFQSKRNPWQQQVVAVWLVVNVVVCERYNACDRAVTFAQIGAVLYDQSGVTFPAELHYLRGPLAVLLFDVNIVTPQCLGVDYHEADSLSFQLGLLLVFVVAYGVPLVADVARGFKLSRRSDCCPTDEPWRVTPWCRRAKKKKTPRRYSHHNPFYGRAWSTFLSRAVRIVGVCYVSIAIASYEVFPCTKILGARRMEHNVDVACGSSRHRASVRRRRRARTGQKLRQKGT